ncbi:MAG: hypothetical protein V4532_13535 [Pseudomonadota bacterium]
MPRLPLFRRYQSRVLTAIWWLAGALVLAAGAWLSAFPLDHRAAHPPVVELADAQVLASSQGMPPDERGNWVRVSLPHRWTQTHGDLEGTLWYRMTMPVSALPGRPWAVYVPRVSMNIEVFVNGVSLGYTGSMEASVTRNWYTPLIFNVPPSLWKQGDNVLMMRVRSGYAGRSGLAPVWVGPSQLLSVMYAKRWWLQVAGVYASSMGLCLLGAFLVVLWRRDRSQSAFGYVGLAAVWWGIGSSATVVPEPLFNGLVWEHLSSAAIVWSELLMCLFFLRFAERRWVWPERVIFALGGVIPLALIAVPTQAAMGLANALVYSMWVVGFAVALWHAYQVRRPDRGLFAFGCLVSIPATLYDIAHQLNYLPFDAVYIMPYAGPVFLACMAFIVAGDYARSRSALAWLNQELLGNIQRREAELRESFQKVATLEQDQAVSAERARILRDMHDGVGAHLTAALRQLNPPDQRPVDLRMVTRTLRESLDQLKLSIDAMSMPRGDVVGLLASLRFRMTPRFKAAGLTLRWEVDELPIWPSGTQAALRQLQYILFEAMSNVLQHAGARQLTLSARVVGDHLLLVLIDDGQGWSGQGLQPEGHGTQAMRSRAGTIGATVGFFSPPQGGYQVRLSLPMTVYEVNGTFNG